MSNADQKECCPEFNPANWDDREITWQDKLFVKDTTISFFHMPLNMGSMMKKICQKIEDAQAMTSPEEFVMLAYDPSPWKGEHYLSVTKEVPDAENVRISGTFLTKVFEGPYRECGKWYKEKQQSVKNN